MSERRLRDLLTATAEPVESPYLAQSSWAAAGRRRRRHRVAGLSVAAAVVVLLVAGGLLIRPTGSADRGPAAHSGPSATVERIPVTIGPTQAGEPKLPRLHTDLGARVDTSVSHAEPLSSHPIRHAVALFSPYPPNAEQGPPPTVDVLALGADGQMRRIDTVDLHSRPDGFQPTPLYADSLSPDGRLAAFPQPSGVTLVDLGTGKARTLSLGCFPDALSWRPDNRHLIGGCASTGSWLLDTTSGQHRTVPYNAADVAVPTGGRRSPVTEWQPSGRLHPTPLRLRVWQGNGSSHTDHRISYRYGEPDSWEGMAWRTSSTVARAASTDGRLRLPGSEPNLNVAGTVLAVDPHDGSATRLLALYNDPSHEATMRYKGCCSVLGWRADTGGEPDIVLVDSRGAAGHRILGWNTATGKLSLVTTLTVDATISLARR